MRSVSPHSAIPRTETLITWRRALVALQDEFVAAVSKDTGRSEAESYLYDWMPVESTLEYLADNIGYFAEPRRISSGLPGILGRRHLEERRLPLGRVLVVGTWNFPLSLHLAQILFALAAGNTVTFKSSPFTPEVARLFALELPRIFGPDRFRMWEQDDAECVRAVEKGEFQGLIFTGGTSAAKIYARAAAESFTKCILEASGSEVALVHASTLEKGVPPAMLDHLLWALLHFNGQTCVAPRYWFVPQSHLDEVWSALRSTLSSAEARESFASRAPLRHEGVVREFASWVEWASALSGAEVFRPLDDKPATFVRLPRLSDLPAQSPSSFGPGAVVVGYESFEEAVAWVRASPWSLMTQIYADKLSSTEWRSVESLETSIVSLGESIVSVGDPAVAFGGRGLSGSGVTHGIEGLRELTRVQVILEVHSWPLTTKWLYPSFTRVGELAKRVPLLKSMRKKFS
jgi:acyl-CoA reductase-like NAD-dependent aldehyde dehydrogenase